ncbi:MAG: bifunctional phosphoserine phosphatase/homoserine phosphotransferase ThrH [Desulfobacteraceae bacterium]|nr:bifunctional phosphoserine phosphatase/homoserine phosphotransferase ThrH [Desulfobacteraceae bacterium]
MQHILCSDLEGVFVPEIWINVAEKTGIEELRLTTRDISDYNVLMDRRLSVLDAHGLTLEDIRAVIAEIDPLPGALEFLDALRAEHQIIIVSDTFIEFAGPLMEKLKRPTLFCNCLKVDANGRITGYELRQQDGKKKTTRALQSLNFRVIAFGDSYNDISMLKAADSAFLFRPPENVTEEFPHIPVTYNYDELMELIQKSVTGSGAN